MALIRRWLRWNVLAASVLLWQVVPAHATPRVVLHVGPDGAVSAPDMLDLLACPGEDGTFEIVLDNTSAAPESDSFTATLPAGVSLLPGSCSADIGMCDFPDSSTVKWSGTVPANGSATVVFHAMVDPDATVGSHLCLDFEITFGSGSLTLVEAEVCLVIEACRAPAPALGRFGAATLAVLLLAAGWVVARRRAA